MYKYILEQAGNINWMAVFALVTFCCIFGGSILLLLRSDREFISHMAALPLEDDAATIDHEKDTNHAQK